MTPRARLLLFAWFMYGTLQLGLLGVSAASEQMAVGSRDARPSASAQSMTATKRLGASERTERGTRTPFAPSVIVVIGLANAVEPSRVTGSSDRATSFELTALPPARAPPVLV